MVAVYANGRQRTVKRFHRGSRSRSAGRTASVGRPGSGRYPAVVVPSKGSSGGGSDPGTRIGGKCVEMFAIFPRLNCCVFLCE